MGSGQLRKLYYTCSINMFKSNHSAITAWDQPYTFKVSECTVLLCKSKQPFRLTVTTSILQYSLQPSDKVSVTYDIVYTSIQYIKVLYVSGLFE